ncbi:helix-turn-helix transcriptional regulator [Solwaraspora sp. WMMD791]|uniref:helix-turn-helix domain-containing protein n=1 Tax=Solwaraspora sp. WMMD791 TaxID=3016086 RepID=UPI00249C33B5|nr:helix-turn-helix transcriptional regulator [Solwaraspora sp. WMMD791]WFE29469.1 helix-turn-helix transcriptional regulator [Solwaraspora sp. WMMD791]
MWIKAFKAARAAADVSQDQLAPKINYSASTIAAVETGRRRPTMTLAVGADEALDTGGLLAEMLDLINKKQSPSWFASWRTVEDRAVKLRTYEPLLVPGLLQTEEYARAVFTGTGLYTPDGVEEQVSMRLDRQRLLTREKPPVFVAVVDEGALRRIVGDTVVQLEQLNYLLKLINERRHPSRGRRRGACRWRLRTPRGPFERRGAGGADVGQSADRGASRACLS